MPRVQEATARPEGVPMHGPYEIAFLSGRQKRVVQTALLALYERGVVRVSRLTHRVDTAVREDDDAPALHPVEAALLKKVPRTGTPLADLLVFAGTADAVWDVCDALIDGGLLGAGFPRRLRPTREGRAVLEAARRGVLPGFPPGGRSADVGRLAALGPSAVEDAKMRAVLCEPPPKRVRLSRGGFRSRGWGGLDPASVDLRYGHGGDPGGDDSGGGGGAP
ncbi:TIGR04222 domain-containing membrane protein [Actinomadura sp. WAC 06369]|uniref:TIGR04222 domain-containing membrane protein n=1 Tax=Actinomadura sp. WAC 06369 TaxID=2203193 RepID=UPI00227866CA|nr:TIGR04222 domain-containing membrane protein [Actinomadura sp. WAC 06369]